jgi:hypothetical protein
MDVTLHLLSQTHLSTVEKFAFKDNLPKKMVTYNWILDAQDKSLTLIIINLFPKCPNKKLKESKLFSKCAKGIRYFKIFFQSTVFHTCFASYECRVNSFGNFQLSTLFCSPTLTVKICVLILAGYALWN